MTGQGCVRCLQFCYGNLNLCTLTGSSILFYSKISSIQLFLLSVTDVILAQLLDFVDGSINVPLGFFFFFFFITLHWFSGEKSQVLSSVFEKVKTLR